MNRHTRYQGFIIQDNHVLLIQHKQLATGRAYWVVPGGGREDGETEEECVIREMLEETNLNVRVERMLFDEPVHPEGMYLWRKTYLCTPIGGEASPGYEPELEASAEYAITAVRWVDLRDESGWGERLQADPFTYPQLVALREQMGYT